MSGSKVFCTNPLVTVGVLLFFFLQPGHHVAGGLRLYPRAYIERGDRVEQRYEAYAKRLAKHYAALVDAVKQNAPDLLVYLQPSQPIARGYQVLPRIMRDGAVDKHAPTGPVAYSWPWTERLIDDELRELVHNETDLRRVAETASSERRAILERLAREQEQQARRLQNIHAHVQYNRLWQAAIAMDRAGYDRETALYAAVVEHQEILNRLSHAKATLATTFASIAGPLGLTEWIDHLNKREAALTRRIGQTLEYAQMPAFIKLVRSNHDWIFHVPLLTDVADREYVAAVKRIIETTWHLNDGNAGYRVELDVTYVSTDALYADGEKPLAGKEIDVPRHLKRFASGGAILTTGAPTTHVRGSAIVLGPQPIPARVLAHEFGHLLGFRDRYARGYKDLGEDGFQVMEALVDPHDIMAASSNGVVRRSHFLKLLEHSQLKSLRHRVPT